MGPNDGIVEMDLEEDSVIGILTCVCNSGNGNGNGERERERELWLVAGIVATRRPHCGGGLGRGMLECGLNMMCVLS